MTAVSFSETVSETLRVEVKIMEDLRERFYCTGVLFGVDASNPQVSSLARKSDL